MIVDILEVDLGTQLGLKAGFLLSPANTQNMNGLQKAGYYLGVGLGVAGGIIVGEAELLGLAKAGKLLSSTPALTEVKNELGFPGTRFRLGPIAAEEANNPFLEKGMRPPYDPIVRPRTIKLNNPKILVRVYSDENFASGQWMLRPKEIEGLTPLEIKEKFALPMIPTMITEVHLPEGVYLRVGRVAAQEGWGIGGAI